MSVRILIADDSANWSAPFCEFLRLMGYEADSVATGTELDNFIKSEPDKCQILIVDNSMPVTPGGPEVPYCGVQTLGSLIQHFRNGPPRILKRVIVRSIYSKADVEVLRGTDDSCIKLGCEQVKTEDWFDRSAPLDDLIGAIERLSRI